MKSGRVMRGLESNSRTPSYSRRTHRQLYHAGRIVPSWNSLTLCLFSLLAADDNTIRFVDIAAASGLTVPNTFGGKETKDYILESTGTGAAIFDYNGDGANDVFIANGTTLDKNAPPRRSQLYRN